MLDPSSIHCKHIFVAGYPSDLGGANTECWHTARLWRRFGLEVTFLPAWNADGAWQTRLESIGCPTIHASPEQLSEVPGLRESVVASFSNTHFLREAARFQDLGCRIVWVGCMTWLFPGERKHYASCKPFDAYVFQSEYQQSEVQPQLAKFGVRPEQCHRIRGALAWEEFPFEPLARVPGEPLVPIFVYQSAPLSMTSGMFAQVSTLLRLLGRFHRPATTVWMCLARGSPTLPSMLSISAVDSPQTNAPPPRLILMSKQNPVPRMS